MPLPPVEGVRLGVADETHVVAALELRALDVDDSLLDRQVLGRSLPPRRLLRFAFGGRGLVDVFGVGALEVAVDLGLEFVEVLERVDRLGLVVRFDLGLVRFADEAQQQRELGRVDLLRRPALGRLAQPHQLELEVRGSTTQLLQQLQNVIDELIVLAPAQAIDEVAADLVEVELVAASHTGIRQPQQRSVTVFFSGTHRDRRREPASSMPSRISISSAASTSTLTSPRPGRFGARNVPRSIRL
ncbi:hypothetical protein ENSA5_41800 [Enhygromyxa salina]|uniref:Uncharacterized protein n=1 Tax=Enhygromyxa salina TaxID=215803 RepID=A0A2S9XM71_9BACT|nr:hypothetical protein ENSA5_41800 [Enhygromyxa salina]